MEDTNVYVTARIFLKDLSDGLAMEDTNTYDTDRIFLLVPKGFIWWVNEEKY